MQRRNNDAQKIANLFALATISVICVFLVLYVRYGAGGLRKSALVKIKKNIPLQCLKNNHGFEKLTDTKLIKNLFVLYKKKELKIFGGIIKNVKEDKNSKNSNGKKLKDIIPSQKEVRKIFLKEADIKKNTKKPIFLAIYYEIIQAKQKNSLGFVGVLKTSFRFNGHEAYRIFLNLKNYKKDEIQAKILCSLRSFENNAK